MTTYDIIREDNPPKIRQVLFYIDNSKKYLFDVNQNITINTLKKMLIAASSLSSDGLRIFHNNIEYTYKTTSTLEELFPNLQLIEFQIKNTEDGLEDDKDFTKIKLKYYCSEHDGKYANFYCYDCRKSICNYCLSSGLHFNHQIKEKYDYLQSSQTLVEIIFGGLNEIFNNTKGFNQDNINILKTEISNEFFPQLHNLLNQLENQIIDTIDFYFKKQQYNYKTMQKNYITLKNECVEGLDELKEEIGIEDMMVDDNVFLIFDEKVNSIKSERQKIDNDYSKFKTFSQILSKIRKNVEEIFYDIYSVIQKHLETQEFKNIQQEIENQTLSEINQEEIKNRILSGVPIKDKKEFSRKLKENRKKVLRTAENKNQIIMTPLNNNKSNIKYNTNQIFINQNPNPFSSSGDNQNFQNNNTNIKIKTTLEYVTPFGNGKDSSTNVINLEENQHIKGFNNESLIKDEKINSEQIVENVCSVLIGNKKIAIFNSKNNKIDRKNIDFKEFTGINYFLPECSWVNIDNKMYIQGGNNENLNSSKTFFVYDAIGDNFIRLKDCINEHSSHSLFASNKFIYCIGGKSKQCERYNIETGQWQLFPNLIFIQQYPVLYIHNNYLYSFFGLNENGKEIDRIQRINLRNPKRYWESVEYQKNDCDLKMYGCGIIKSSNNTIYFIAGKDKNGVRSKSIEFNFNNFSASQSEFLLQEKGYFKDSILPKLNVDTYGNFTLEEINSFIIIPFISR